MNTRLNSVGLYFVLLLLVLVPLHQEVSQLVTYYREIFGLVFIVLLFMHGPSNIFRSVFNRRVYVEVLFLVLFPLLIFVTAIFDPMVNLYGTDFSEILSSDEKVNPKLYIFRNAVIYLPMVFYIAVRGLSQSEINKIAGVSALIAPVSVALYIRDVYYFSPIGDYSVMSQFERLFSGQLRVAYNSYVPYLTFSVLSIVYLLELNYNKHIMLVKTVLVSLLVFVFAFIFYSTSRQSIILAVFYMVVFLAKNLSVSRLRNALYYAILLVALYYTYELLTINYGENYHLIDKLSG